MVFLEVAAHGIPHLLVQIGHRVRFDEDRGAERARREATLGSLFHDENDLAHAAKTYRASPAAASEPDLSEFELVVADMNLEMIEEVRRRLARSATWGSGSARRAGIPSLRSGIPARGAVELLVSCSITETHPSALHTKLGVEGCLTHVDTEGGAVVPMPMLPAPFNLKLVDSG